MCLFVIKCDVASLYFTVSKNSLVTGNLQFSSMKMLPEKEVIKAWVRLSYTVSRDSSF